MNPAVVHVASGREWRGGQRQVWLLARELGRMGVDQLVVTGDDSELARRVRSAGVPVRATAWRAGLDPRVLGPLLHELRKRPRVVVHAHDAHALTLAGVCTLASGTPLVVTRRVTFPLRRQFFWRRACRIIAISQAVRAALVADGLEPERLVVVPSAVDPSLSGSPAVGIRTQLGLPPDGQVAVSLGALTREKDQSTLITTAARLVRDLPDLHWVLVGDGPLKEKLEQQITRSGLQHRFHLLGDLADPHLLLAEADVFVLSSTSEGLGTSALAAMAYGVPVVASRVGGVPDLLGSGGGMLVQPGEPTEFAGAVHRVLTDPGLRQRLIGVASKEVQRFSVGAMAERVLSVYRSCAHSLDGS